MKTPSCAERIQRLADLHEFEPHRIRFDQTGRYDEPLDREFPFLIKLFNMRTNGPTWHERLELFIAVDDHITMRTGDRLIKLAPGEIMIVDNLKLHIALAAPGTTPRAIVVSFLPEFVYSLGSPSHDYFSLGPFYAHRHNRLQIVRESPELVEMHGVLGHLLRCYVERGAYHQVGCKAYFLALLYHLVRYFAGDGPDAGELTRQREVAARLKPVLEHVAAHYAESIPLGRATTLARMSVSQFLKTFKKSAGMTFVDYVTHVRLSHAVRLLRESSLTIAEVANEVGFSDQSYFDRRFKRAFRQTPRAFRQQAQGEEIVQKKSEILLGA